VAISLKLPAPPSDAEIIAISERNPGFKFERSAAGELLVTPAGGEAGRQEFELCRQLGQWAKADGSGVGFGPATGFRMPDGALFIPDACWVRQDRWQALTAEERRGLVPLCPDAVFEILSPTDALANLRAKMRAYLANGAGLAVLIDPERRAVELFAPHRPPEVVEFARTISCDPVLPGFTLDLEPIFS
jgi:Uma2 family endonuclease